MSEVAFKLAKNKRSINFQASQNMWLDSSHKWLLIDDDNAETEIYNDTVNTILFDKGRNATLIEVLDNLTISVDADIVLARRGKFVIVIVVLKIKH